jgi:hypothetical protein
MRSFFDFLFKKTSFSGISFELLPDNALASGILFCAGIGESISYHLVVGAFIDTDIIAA